jgi:hypothetical protein
MGGLIFVWVLLGIGLRSDGLRMPGRGFGLMDGTQMSREVLVR